MTLNPDHVRSVLEAINHGPYFKLLSMVVKEMGIGYSGCTGSDKQDENSPELVYPSNQGSVRLWK